MLVDDFDPLKGKMLQILDKDGNVDKRLEPAIDGKRLLEAYRTMVLTRIADDKAVRAAEAGPPRSVSAEQRSGGQPDRSGDGHGR